MTGYIIRVSFYGWIGMFLVNLLYLARATLMFRAWCQIYVP